MLFHREYYNLQEASVKLKCTVMDILHLAAANELELPIYAYLNLEKYNILCCRDENNKILEVLKFPYVHNGLASLYGYDIREIIRLGGLDNGILINQAQPLYSSENEARRYCLIKNIDFDSLGINYFTSEQMHPNIYSWQISKPFIASEKNLYLRSEDIDFLMENNKADKSTSHKENESMIKIIYALAKNGYKYPDRGALADILKDFELNKNGVSENTLIKYLKAFDTL